MICFTGVWPSSGFMGDGPRGIQMFPDHFSGSTEGFAASTSAPDAIPSQTSSATYLRSHSHKMARKRLRSAAASMLHLFSLRAITRGRDETCEDKIVLSAEEVESLRSELAALEERESHCKAQLEQMNEILRSARLSGYLSLRTRWEAFPGDPPPIDDNEVDDWLPRFIVLHGSCIYLYVKATDISPQDSTLLSDIVAVGHLPSFTRKDDGTQYCFYILTRYGLRYECSSLSRIKVGSWLTALQQDCKLISDSKDVHQVRNGEIFHEKKLLDSAYSQHDFEIWGFIC